MTKKDLVSYRDLMVEKRQLEERLSELKEDLSQVRSPQFSYGPKGSKTYSKVEAYVAHLSDTYIKLLNKKHAIVKALDEIEEAISALDIKERLVLREYYMNGSTWQKAAGDLGLSLRQISKIHAGAVEKMAKGKPGS